MRRVRIPFFGDLLVIPRDESILYFQPELRARLIRGEHTPSPWGRREVDCGVLSRRVVTTVGVTFLCDDWRDNGVVAGYTADITNFNVHASGTDVAHPEAAADTALYAEVTTIGTPRVAGAKSKPAANQLLTAATILYSGGSFSGPAAISEHGLFDQTAPSGSHLWDRSLFSGSIISVSLGDSISFSYTLTVAAGG